MNFDFQRMGAIRLDRRCFRRTTAEGLSRCLFALTIETHGDFLGIGDCGP